MGTVRQPASKSPRDGRLGAPGANVLCHVEADIRTKHDIVRDGASAKGLPFKRRLATLTLVTTNGDAGRIGRPVAPPAAGELGLVTGNVWGIDAKGLIGTKNPARAHHVHVSFFTFVVHH